MKFVRECFTSPETGDEAMLWVPERGQTRLPVWQSAPVVSLEGEPRELVPAVFRTIVRFQRNIHARSKLGQDCIIFAAACQEDKSFANQPSHGYGMEVDDIDVTRLPDGGYADVAPGSTINMLGSYDHEWLGRISRRWGFVHQAVKATCDDAPEKPPLFASKLGFEGGVCLAEMPELAKYYYTDTCDLVGHLRVY